MKKIFQLFICCFLAVGTVKAQVLPSFQFGVKAGTNLTGLSNTGNLINSNTQVGYLGGFWARVGALGFNFQPEIYLTGKKIDVNSNGVENKATFTSIDVPLLFGNKIGAFGVGARFYTGPDLSFAINKDQNFNSALHDAVHLDYKDQNLAWQFGAGLDIKKISFDLRYELGLTKQTFDMNSNQQTHVNLFTLTMSYRLFSL